MAEIGISGPAILGRILLTGSAYITWRPPYLPVKGVDIPRVVGAH